MYQSHYQLIADPLQLLDQYSRWRKRAELIQLSDKAKLRLEWIIFYHTAGKHNASYTAKHFSISRSKFYFWYSRFNEKNLKTLEDNPSIPKNHRYWNPDPLIIERMIKLRKEFIHWSKLKLAVVYQNIYGEKISSWQFQRVIQTFKLYPPKKRKSYQGNGAKKQLISYQLRHTLKNLFSIDTKVLWLFNRKYYAITAVSHAAKLTYMRAYTTHSSMAAADFLARLEYLVQGKLSIVLTDNGTEFAKYFNRLCLQKNIQRYYSRVRTPKDNPEAERMIKTFLEEWICDGHWSPNLHKFNRYITNFLIIYNTIRPHQTLNYLTPVQYAEKQGLLSKRSSSSTIH